MSEQCGIKLAGRHRPSGLTRRPRKRQHPRLVFGAASLTSSLGAPPPLQPCAATLCGRRSELEHDDSVDESDDEKCALCGSAEDDPGRNDILLCDACGGGFHTRCLQPPLGAVPPGDWFCAGCARKRRKSAVYQARARAERKSRGGPNGRRPKQQNGWLIDMHGEITGACYACKVIADAKAAGATAQHRGARPHAAHVCGREQAAATVAQWAQHEQHDWYECGSGEGVAPLEDRRCGVGNRAPADSPQPLAPRAPSADVVIVLAKAQERGRYIVAVSRPRDDLAYGRREWKLFSWPRSAVHERQLAELERHGELWASHVGPLTCDVRGPGGLLHTCDAATGVDADADTHTNANADANADAAPPAADTALPAAAAAPPAAADAAPPAADNDNLRPGRREIHHGRFGLFSRLLISSFIGGGLANTDCGNALHYRVKSYMDREQARSAASEAAAEKGHPAAGLLVAHEQAENDGRTNESGDTGYESQRFETHKELSFEREEALLVQMFESLGRGAMLPLYC